MVVSSHSSFNSITNSNLIATLSAACECDQLKIEINSLYSKYYGCSLDRVFIKRLKGPEKHVDGPGKGPITLYCGIFGI